MINLGSVADIQMGYPFRSGLQPDPQGNITVIQMKDLDHVQLLPLHTATQVQLTRYPAHHLLCPGDLLFRSRGHSYATVQVPQGIGTTVLAAPMLRIRPHAVLPEYLCWYINTPTAQAQLTQLARGTSVQMIGAETLKTLEVPLPAPSMQQHIALVASLAQQEQALATQITQLRHQLSTHLLTQLAREATL